MATGTSAVGVQPLSSISIDETLATIRKDRKASRRKSLIIALAILIVALFSLCQGVSTPGTLYSPAQVLGSLAGWFELNVGAIFVPTLALNQSEILAAYPMYYEVTTRVVYTLVTLVCGALLALSGMLYQNVFRNPIAAPTMLGVTSGVTCGMVALVAVYGAQAVYLTGQRYLYCFLGGIAILLVVMGLGRLASGSRGLNLVDMLLVGTIISSLLGTTVSYVINYRFTDSQWLTYYNVSNATDLDASPFSLVVLAIATVLSVTPVVAMRFRMNAIALSDSEIRLLGIRPTGLRVIALASGSLMILTAQTLCGAVSMVSLVVPFLARAIYGSEFRKQMVGNVLIGALVLLICRDLVSAIPFVGTGIPLGTMVTVVTLPAFAWVMAVFQKQWLQ